VKTSAFMGTYYEAQIDLSGHTVIVITNFNLDPGDTVYISLRLNPE
jgi:hypothetical protein